MTPLPPLSKGAIRNPRPSYGVGLWLVSFFVPLAVAGLLYELVGVGLATAVTVAVAGMLIGTVIEVRLINRSLPRAGNGDVMIYVELLEEGVEVYRPVHAERSGDVYRLPPAAPGGEVWRTPPGSLVRCENRDGVLLAVEVV